MWIEDSVALARSSGGNRRTSLSSEHFRVSYPITVPQKDAEGLLRTLESARAGLRSKISAAGIHMAGLDDAEIYVNDTTGDFVGRTGQPSWAAGVTRKNRTDLQPLAVLKRRGILESTVKHELAHMAIDDISGGRAPRWLAEGMAIYFAGEGRLLRAYLPKSPSSIDKIEQALDKPSSADEMRRAYAAAFAEVSRLIAANGEPSVWQLIARG
jgi:hypothetical protein